jgi:hypothetical protein
MQHTTFTGRDAAGRAANGKYLLGSEFSFNHPDRMRLQPAANLFNFEQNQPSVT